MWRPLLVTFVIGLLLGGVVGFLGPELAAPYLPDMLRGKAEIVEGEVTQKQREGDRLLLTVITSRGAILATFGQRVNEVELLVERGDTVTLRLRRFEPFVVDPEIRQVKKRGTSGIPPATQPSPARPEPAAPGPLGSSETTAPVSR